MMEPTEQPPLPFGQSEPGSQARKPMDERVFVWVIGVASVAIALMTTLSVLRKRHPEPTIESMSAVEFGLRPASASSRQLIPFRLTDRTGRVVERGDLNGKLLVVNFVFSSCSLVCLQVNNRMADIQRLASGQEDVQLVSFTVDPQSDSPQVLTRFAAQFGADTNRWMFLTGSKRVLYPLLEKSFLGAPNPSSLEGVPGGWEGTHGIIVVDKQGIVRAGFDGMKPGTPQQVMQAISTLRGEEQSRAREASPRRDDP